MVMSAALALVASPVAALAAVDAYMVFQPARGGTLQGDSTTPSGEKGAFEIQNYSFDVEQVLAARGAASAPHEVRFSPFSITRHVDQASPTFFRMAASGGRFRAIILETRRHNGQLARIALHDVTISGYRRHGAGPDASETFTLTPTRAEVIGGGGPSA